MSGEQRQRELGSRPTIQDVAELAGVSIATVSRVLNSHPDVSPSTRAEVLKRVSDLGYVSNRVAEPRVSQRVRLVALAVPDVRDEYVTEIVAAATDELLEHGARLVLCPVERRNGGTAPLRERLLPGTTDGGLLILPAESSDQLIALQESGYRFVLIEPAMPVDDAVPVVAATNWAGARMATEHLIGLGHTHIAIVTGPPEWRISEERLAGYHAALLAAGIPLSSRLVQTSDTTIAGGRDAGAHLLSLAHAPSAIIALNDAMAVGVLEAARALSLHVSHDLSVVAFDDLTPATITSPQLTAVQQP